MNIYPKTYFAESKNLQTGTCFVIMPFAEKYKEVYDIIKDTVESEELKFSCKRGDDFLRPHILETILHNIAKAEYVIADLTGQNANVFYELGLAHCVKEMDKIILITQNMEDVPFDLRQYRCIAYDQTISGARKLHKDIIDTFKANIGHQFRITLNDGEKLILPEKLSGDGHFLYNLIFEAPAIGRNASKLQIHFKRFSAEGEILDLQTQYLYLELQSNEMIENIPWQIRLVNAGEGKATFIVQEVR